jgi:hypothetical protein
MRIINYLMAALLLAACGTARNGGGNVRVDGTIMMESPVCEAGKEPLRGQPKMLPGASYYIKKGETNDPAVIAGKLLRTDENGKFTIRLEPGTYSILHADKLMSFEEFRLKYGSTSTYLRDRDDDCFRRWYESPDFLLKVANDTVVTYTVKSRCYTYTNPCVEYTGPK